MDDALLRGTFIEILRKLGSTSDGRVFPESVRAQIMRLNHVRSAFMFSVKLGIYNVIQC